MVCHECLDEARRLLSSPWILAARARWPMPDILGDGPIAVVTCDGRRIVLMADRPAAEVGAGVDRWLCGAGCRGDHVVEPLEPHVGFPASGHS